MNIKLKGHFFDKKLFKLYASSNIYQIKVCMNSKYLKSLVCFVLIESIASAGTDIYWTGSTSQVWTGTTSNWTPSQYPTGSDDAFFNASANSKTVEVNASGGTAQSLNFSGANYTLTAIIDYSSLDVSANTGSIANLTSSTAAVQNINISTISSGTISIDNSSILILDDSSIIANGSPTPNALITGGGLLTLQNNSGILFYGTLSIINATLTLGSDCEIDEVDYVIAGTNSVINVDAGFFNLTTSLNLQNNASISNLNNADIYGLDAPYIEIKDQVSFSQTLGNFGRSITSATISGGSISSYGTNTNYNYQPSLFLSYDMFKETPATFIISGTPNIYLEGTRALHSCYGTFSGGSITVKGLIERLEIEGENYYYSQGGLYPSTFIMTGNSEIRLLGGNFVASAFSEASNPKTILSGGTLTLDCYVDQNGRLARPAVVSFSDGIVTPYQFYLENAMKVINNGGYLGGGTACEFILNDEAYIANMGTTIGGTVVVAGLYQKLILNDNAQIVTNQNSLMSFDQLTVNSGTIVNEGVLQGVLDIKGGTITGDGTLSCAYVVVTEPGYVHQKTVNFYENYYSEAFLINNGTIVAENILVTGTNTLSGEGSLSGTLTVSSGGIVYPGNGITELQPPYSGTLTLNGNCEFNAGGILKVDISNSSVNSLNISSGTLTLQPGAILYAHLYDSYSKPQNLVIAELASLPSGNFTVESDQALIGYTVTVEDQLPTQNMFSWQAGPPYYLVLNVSRNPFTVLGGNPNQEQVEMALDNLFGNTSDCLQKKMDGIISDNSSEALSIFDQMQNSELKGQQVTIEELFFAVNDQFKPYLYEKHQGLRPFVLAGYNYQQQQQFYQYFGYDSISEYEFLGLTYGYDKLQFFGALGSMQSKTRIKKKNSRAKATSANGAFGIGFFSHRFNYGFDVLGGCYWLNTKRGIQSYDLKAKSSHKLWNFKSSLHGEYVKPCDHWDFHIYDDVTYYVGHESAFKESGAECLSLDVDASNRQVIRNAFGLKGVFLKSENVHPYIDLAYVYEDRLSGKYYYTRFKNTSPVMKIEGVAMTKNFAKLNFGLSGLKNSTYYQFNFAGLYGQRYFEQEFSISLDHKF